MTAAPSDIIGQHRLKWKFRATILSRNYQLGVTIVLWEKIILRETFCKLT